MEESRKTAIEFLTNYGFQMVGALLILIAGAVLARILGGWLDRLLTRKDMEPPLRLLICRALKFLIFAFTFVLALDKFGVQVAPLVAGIGVAGVGIGLAMQGVLSNIVAGLTIIVVKPFRIGEWVEMAGITGKVETIGLFSTKLSNPDRSRIIIPNRKIVGEVLHNYGAIRQLDLTVGVAYATDLNKALAAVQAVLAENPRALQDPAPRIGVSALADSSINIAVKPWVLVDDVNLARAEIYKAIVERFRVENILIPFPQREVRVLDTVRHTGAAA
jgi:small conductance mechanosensitive channel